VNDSDDALTKLLGATPPAGIAALSEADRAQLVDVITSAQQTQRESLTKSFDATLRFVPFPLRGVVRRVLTG
jgi:hypothetical protein